MIRNYTFPLLFLLVACELTEHDMQNHNVTNLLEEGNAFLIEVKVPAGKTDEHAFLTYPGNYGLLEGNKEIEVLALGESVASGKKLAVSPLGLLKLKEGNILRNVIIATPADTLQQIISASDFQHFIVENVGEKQILQDWFLFQKGLGVTNLIGWEDEQAAWSIINNGEKKK